MIACFHIHTKYSFDSLMAPKKILKICKKLGADTVFITDHNTIRGALVAKKYEKEIGIEVVLGTEIKTEYGDIIGIYLEEDIKDTVFEKVIEAIKNQNGITILPHPYRNHKNLKDLARKVDIIEVWNGHSSPLENEKSLKLAESLKKPIVVGSDAHLYSELGNAILYCNSLYDNNKTFYTKYPSNKQKDLSNLIGSIKTGKIWNIPFIILHMVR